jgi:D-alanyl-D-alanine carboxypeptidase (penicillin-binding protein 5/6)
MSNTSFKNSSGVFDFQHFSTVKDFSILSSYLIKNYSEFYRYFKEKEYLWVRTGGQPVMQSNRNVLLVDENVDGIKTGNLKDSRYSIAATKKINNRRVIVVISGLPTMTSRADEVRRIFLQYFNRTELALIPYETDLFRIDIWNGSVSSLNVRGSNKEGIYFIKNKGQKIQKPRIEIDYETPTKIPIIKGEHIANAKVFNGKDLLHIEKLYAEKNVTEKNIFLKGWQNIKYALWN